MTRSDASRRGPPKLRLCDTRRKPTASLDGAESLCEPLQKPDSAVWTRARSVWVGCFAPPYTRLEQKAPMSAAPMPAPETAELKRLLRSEGFEIYRTLDGRVLLAERVRDNLIMDSGVAAGPVGAPGGGIVCVFVTIRAQLSHFPGASSDAVLSHARDLARPFEGRGYQAGEPTTSDIVDPSHPDRTLDKTFEIPLLRELSDLDQLLGELRVALSLQRSSSDG
jgi:hypothetical protein